MNLSLIKNKYLNAVLLVMLFSAAVHMVILFVYAIWRQDLNALNYFNILTLNYFFPGAFDGLPSFLLSLVVVAIIYAVILKVQKKHGAS